MAKKKNIDTAGNINKVLSRKVSGNRGYGVRKINHNSLLFTAFFACTKFTGHVAYCNEQTLVLNFDEQEDIASMVDILQSNGYTGNIDIRFITNKLTLKLTSYRYNVYNNPQPVSFDVLRDYRNWRSGIIEEIKNRKVSTT